MADAMGYFFRPDGLIFLRGRFRGVHLHTNQAETPGSCMVTP